MIVKLDNPNKLSKETLGCTCSDTGTISCKILIDNINCKVTGSLPTCFWNDLSHRMSYEVPGAFFSPTYQNRYWDGRKRLFNKRNCTFPTGLLSLLKDTCKDHFVNYTFSDLRVKPSLGSPIPLKGIALRDYQLGSADTCMLKQRGMIRVATGGGKTEIIAELIGRTNIPTVIFIHKQDIFHQLVDRLSKRLGVPIGKIGCGTVYPQNITVCMIQTAYKAYGGEIKKIKDVDEDETLIPRPEIIKQCIERSECVMIDEAHHTSSDIFSFILPRCVKGFYRWGFSATPFREDKADLILDAHTGPICVDISASELIKRGYLSKPTIFLYEFDHSRPVHTNYASLYTQQVVKNVFRNKMIVQSALKAVSFDKTCLIAVTRIEHGETLEAMLEACLPGKVRFASGKLNSEDRKQILKDLDSRKLSVVISTTVFGEGVDCPSLDVLINTKAAQSGVDSYQLLGRALRKTPTKDKVVIIDIYDDHCKYLGKHSKRRLEIYKTEPEFIIKKINLLDHLIFPTKVA